MVEVRGTFLYTGIQGPKLTKPLSSSKHGFYSQLGHSIPTARQKKKKNRKASGKFL